MSKTRQVATYCIAAIVAASATTLAHSASLQDIKDRGQVRIAVANEIPYGYMDLKGQAKGVGPDVAKHIMEQLGIKKIEWITTNFGYLIPGLRAKRFDMVAAEMAILPQRYKECMFSDTNSVYGHSQTGAQGHTHNLPT